MPRRTNGSITQLPDGRWLVRITVPATATSPARRPHRTTKGRNRKEAERLLRELQAEIVAAGVQAPEIYKPRPAITLAEYVRDRYRLSLDADVAASRLRVRTAEEYAKVLDLRVLPLLGHRRVSSLTSADADLVAASVRRRQLAPATTRRAVESLRRVMKRAEKDGLLMAGTARNLELPPGPVAREPKRITPEDVRALLPVLLSDAEVGEPAALPALLALYCGLRTSEALAVTWE